MEQELLFVIINLIIFASDLRENGKAFARMPFFVNEIRRNIMDFKTELSRLLNEFLKTRPDLFLVDLKISASSDVTVILDGDQGVTLQDCLDVSRAVEFNMDREIHDFSLQVMSAGLGEPLRFPRQFRKNIGRELEVTLNDNSEVQGELMTADDEKIVLKRAYKRPKIVGKGKETVIEEREIPYADIKKALVVIKF